MSSVEVTTRHRVVEKRAAKDAVVRVRVREVEMSESCDDGSRRLLLWTELR